ncbi:MAG: hypothetical protein M3Q17_07460, partial [Actinomycetota bacterium]|nr:hypothetical protein [Actinomycetota bacterium]
PPRHPYHRDQPRRRPPPQQQHLTGLSLWVKFSKYRVLVAAQPSQQWLKQQLARSRVASPAGAWSATL